MKVLNRKHEVVRPELKGLPGGVVLSPQPPLEHASLITKAGRLRKELWRWAKAGAPRRSREDRKRVDAICAVCPYFNASGNWGMGECQAPGCGCTKVKTALATSYCPLKPPKWGPERAR